MGKVRWVFALVWHVLCLTGSSASDFSMEKATAYARLSHAAYCAKSDALRDALTDWTCIPCKNSGVQVVPNSVRIARSPYAYVDDATFGYVARLTGPGSFAGKCLVSVRGSAGIANWFANLDVHHVDMPVSNCPGCQVEEGFLKTWQALQSQFLEHLKNLDCAPGPGMPSPPKVILTGHSLGGAAAVIGMMILHDMGFDVEPGMTIGAPRVGNKALGDRFHQIFNDPSSSFWRVTRNGDPVPLLPPVAGGYWHTSNEAYLDSEGKPTLCYSVESPNCAAGHSFALDLLTAWRHCFSTLIPGWGKICGCPASESEALGNTTLEELRDALEDAPETEHERQTHSQWLLSKEAALVV